MRGTQFSIDIKKLQLEMAKKQLNISSLAKEYGVSRARMNVILNQRTVSCNVLGRMARALGVEPIEIIE